jgi:hypothetical protein
MHHFASIFPLSWYLKINEEFHIAQSLSLSSVTTFSHFLDQKQLQWIKSKGVRMASICLLYWLKDYNFGMLPFSWLQMWIYIASLNPYCAPSTSVKIETHEYL